MHSVNEPRAEAHALYVAQSRLAERLQPAEDGRSSGTDALVIWDVGLGAATNAMAAIACFEQVIARQGGAAVRPVRLVSFERDLDPLLLVTKKSSHFPHVQHAAPGALARQGHWRHASSLLTWELVAGDFLETFPSAPSPDLVFYDPFSAKTDTPLWSPDVFARMVNHGGARPMELFTYSASTAVRAALLWAGFWVAEGVGTGPKASTTIASTRVPAASHDRGATLPEAALLGPAWLARWRRSDSRYPPGLSDAQKAAFSARIESHPQFGSGAA
jgi:queuine tRNA-ribosyltransferase